MIFKPEFHLPHARPFHGTARHHVECRQCFPFIPPNPTPRTAICLQLAIVITEIKYRILSEIAWCGTDYGSDWEEQLEHATAAFRFLNLSKQRRHWYWVQEVKQMRNIWQYHRLMKNLEKDKHFHVYFRMNKEQFKYFLEVSSRDFF